MTVEAVEVDDAAKEVDGQVFRDIWASFPAGVTILTARGADGMPRGLTCTAVCPVSVEPPLILVVVNGQSNTLPAIDDSKAFVVNFMASGGTDLSRRFASKDQDKFVGIDWEPVPEANGSPRLLGVASSYAACVVETVLHSGDHFIFVGRVVAGNGGRDDVLMYFRRSFFASTADGEFSRLQPN